MIDFSQIFDLFAKTSATLVFLIIASHLLSRLFSKKPPLKLDKNSLVVITGACMGIGKQMALQLAHLYNCRLLLIDIRKDLFQQVAQQVNAAGGTCECKQTNLGSKQEVNKLIDYLLDRKKKIDMFLYNAGIVFGKPAWELTEKEHELVMRVNYFTPCQMIKKLEPLLEGGHVAVVASMVAIISGGLNMSAYTASKHALFGYLSSLRQQYKKWDRKITVSIGCPYAINTSMFEGFKTWMDFFIRILDQKYVGKRLVKQFVERKEVCFLYQYEAVVFKLLQWMPTNLIDFAAIKLDRSNYDSIQQRQQSILKKSQ